MRGGACSGAAGRVTAICRQRVKRETMGAEEVVVTGVCTSICVMETVADFDHEAHEFSLNRMAKTFGANVI